MSKKPKEIKARLELIHKYWHTQSKNKKLNSQKREEYHWMAMATKVIIDIALED